MMEIEMSTEPGDQERRDYRVVVEGLLPTPGTWVTLLDQTSEYPLSDAEAQQMRAELEPLLDIVSRSFRDGDRAVLTLGTSRVNVQSFAAIRIDLLPVLQDWRTGSGTE
jgi:hypothetical protein